MKKDKDIRPFFKEPFEILDNAIRDSGMKKEKAIEILSENGYEKQDAEYIIEQLIANGHIYEVEETIYITPTD